MRGGSGTCRRSSSTAIVGTSLRSSCQLRPEDVPAHRSAWDHSRIELLSGLNHALSTFLKNASDAR